MTLLCKDCWKETEIVEIIEGIDDYSYRDTVTMCCESQDWIDVEAAWDEAEDKAWTLMDWIGEHLFVAEAKRIAGGENLLREKK